MFYFRGKNTQETFAAFSVLHESANTALLTCPGSYLHRASHTQEYQMKHSLQGVPLQLEMV